MSQSGLIMTRVERKPSGSLARALIGKEEGDSVEVMTPGGGKSYEVVSVEFK